MHDNPRLINIPPRDSEEWEMEYIPISRLSIRKQQTPLLNHS